jgi:Flp pilus assembly secretin CpaC
VVEGLLDAKRLPVSAMQRIIMLKDISVYTMEEDMPLEEVFMKMKENDAISSSISPKADPADLKSTLKKVLPEFDEERVHVSDIRKMFAWYSLLKDNVSFEKAVVAVEEAEVITEETPKKKTKAKSTSTDDSDVATIISEDAPAKKVARKKKSDDTAEAGSNDEPKAAKKTAKKSAKGAE